MLFGLYPLSSNAFKISFLCSVPNDSIVIRSSIVQHGLIQRDRIFKDVDYTSPHFRMVQYLGLRGYLPEWTARLQEPVDMATLTAWKKLSGKDLPGIEAGKTTRLVALEMIYRKIK